MLPTETGDMYESYVEGDDGEVFYSKQDMGYEFLDRDQLYSRTGHFKKKIQSGRRHSDPWNRTSLAIKYYPIFLTVITTALAIVSFYELDLFPRRVHQHLSH